MSEVPTLINDLALILVVAGIVTLVFKKLRQPLVLGYVVAGFIVSPHMPYTMSVMDNANVKTWADIGVMFLLFSLGLDFSFKKIVKMGIAPVVSTCTIIFAMMSLGITAGHAFGWNRMDCIFLGGMLAMSSTTIIYKAFSDMGLHQQKFAGSVMSVLILEDVLAIVMMVMLSAIAVGNNPDGGEMIWSLLKIAFFLVLWFVIGIFAVPLFLRATRSIINNETLLIVSLGLCCLMAVVSAHVGFSSAFGAFVMGSILAETVEADKIERLVAPVKDLFGAIFFVSVGMLVDPVIIMSYASPIIALVLTILCGQAVFGTAGFMLGGQSLKSAMRCGFSMAQIGEFSFIIASLGVSLRVTGDFLYPVVVAVSVITTFLTPYMIRLSIPAYNMLEKRMPKSWVTTLNNITLDRPSASPHGKWRSLLVAMARNTVVYGILSVAGTSLMFVFFLPFMQGVLPQTQWLANAICGLLTTVVIAPFLRAILMKKNHSEEFKSLWQENWYNRIPLITTILVRLLIVSAFIFYICHRLTHFSNALMLTVALALVTVLVLSRSLKRQSIIMERMFVQNLRSRDISMRVKGMKKPLYEGHLLDRDIHIAEIDLPEDTAWAGECLRDLRLGNLFGVHVSSIQRGRRRINIPGGDTIVFPGDRLQVIGSDSQLAALQQSVNSSLEAEDTDIEKREMKLRQIVITQSSPFLGKKLSESGIRDTYNCMVVGIEEGKENLSMASTSRRFRLGDMVWVVGEEMAIESLKNARVTHDTNPNTQPDK